MEVQNHSGPGSNSREDLMQSVARHPLQNHSLVSDLIWIKKGIAKEIPDKIDIEREDFQRILRGSQEDDELDDDEETEINSNDLSTESGLSHMMRGVGLRSTSSLGRKNDVESHYNLFDYDLDYSRKGPSIKELTCFYSQLEDPYITTHRDSDDEAEENDFKIRPDDNLVVIGKIVHDESSLEVWVWNEHDSDWYCHHDYILEHAPLALAVFDYDPGSENHKGNLVAVGTMDSQIGIWDLDICNSISPVVKLGSSILNSSKKRPSSSRKRNHDGHTDAILSLDWNEQMEHLLASGSADQSVVLWDLDKASQAMKLPLFDGMVQSIRWHPNECSVLLIGTRAGSTSVLDCREEYQNNTPVTWNFSNQQGDGRNNNVEVEQVLWDQYRSFYAFIALDNGKLVCVDNRKPGQIVSEVIAHDGGCSSISQGYGAQQNIIASVGSQNIKFWRILGDSQDLELIAKHPAKMGRLNLVRFAPDSTLSNGVLAIAGENEECVRILDLDRISSLKLG